MLGKFIGLLNSTNNIGCCTKVLILLSGIRSMLYTCTTHIQFIRYTIQGVPYSCLLLCIVSLIFFVSVYILQPHSYEGAWKILFTSFSNSPRTTQSTISSRQGCGDDQPALSGVSKRVVVVFAQAPFRVTNVPGLITQRE